MLKHVSQFICLFALNLLISTPAYAGSTGHDGLVGTWATQGYGAQVLIKPCGTGNKQLCGQIIWLWTDRDADGELLKDVENPTDQLRTRPLVGTHIFRNFAKDNDDRWRGDGIYNPEDGNTYSASLSPQPDGTLNVTGCVLGIFCQTQVWRRPQSVCPAPATIDITQLD